MDRFFHPLWWLAGALTLLFGAGAALAQSYPTGPVRVIVPFPPGGGVDGAGRLISQKLSEALGRQFVVDNRPGANGMIGSELAAKSAKDGYTLMVNGANFVTTPSLYSKVTYDPIRDFEPVSLVALAPNVLVVHPSLPVKSVKDLVALAKARPGQVNFAGSGSGSTPHLAAELFNTLANVKMIHVPYRGTGPAIVGLMSGEASVMFMPTTNAVPLVKGGRLRALAVTSLERVPAMPELPTVSESGLKGYESSQWYGMLAPSRNPGQYPRPAQRAHREDHARPRHEAAPDGRGPACGGQHARAIRDVHQIRNHKMGEGHQAVRRQR